MIFDTSSIDCTQIRGAGMWISNTWIFGYTEDY